MRQLTNTYIILFLLSITLFSCEGDNPLKVIKGDSDISFNESVDVWEELKALEGNSYVFVVSQESFAGFGSNTRIKVEEGRVTERSYESYTRNDQGELEIQGTYVENQAELGTNSQGAEVRNMDQIYEACSSDLLQVDPEENALFFDSFENGVLRLCGYVPNGCQDDCFRGVRLSEFAWL